MRAALLRAVRAALPPSGADLALASVSGARVATAGEDLRADRERVMLSVEYETLARQGELVALEVGDIDFHPNGTGQALIRRGKDGHGRQ